MTEDNAVKPGWFRVRWLALNPRRRYCGDSSTAAMHCSISTVAFVVVPEGEWINRAAN
jgi:hypothetical protein